jgi:hypothetical protein
MKFYLFTFHNFIHYPVLIHNSEGPHVPPDDGTGRLKHVRAIAGWNINNINKIGAFVGLFYMSLATFLC